MDKHNQFDTQPPIRGRQQQHSQIPSTSTNPFEDEKSPTLPEGRAHQKNGLKGSLYLSEAVEQHSTFLMRLLGYGLLVFALLDYIYIVIPPRFTNPAWELQTIGAFAEHAAIPLLGLMLVFYRYQGYITKLEKNLLGFLSRISLLLGLLYLLMVPLGIIDTGRIYHSNNAQIAAQLSQQRQQVEQIKVKLNQATTDEQLRQLFASLTPEGRSLKINKPQAFKEQSLAQISQAERNIQVKADSARANQIQVLLKNSIKWNLAALVSGILFIWIWHLTRWARVKESRTR